MLGIMLMVQEVDPKYAEDPEEYKHSLLKIQIL